MEYRENNIEFYTNQDLVTASFTQLKLINKMRHLAEKYPNEVNILAENSDGSILVHMPLSYLHIFRPAQREYTDEERKIMADRINTARMVKKNV